MSHSKTRNRESERERERERERARESVDMYKCAMQNRIHVRKVANTCVVCVCVCWLCVVSYFRGMHAAVLCCFCS